MENNEELKDQTKSDRIFIYILAGLYLIVSFLQIFVSVFVGEMLSNESESVEAKLQIINIFIVFIGLIKILLSVNFVTFGMMFGFWVALCFNILNAASSWYFAFATQYKIAYSGLAFSVFSMIICSLVLKEKKLTDTHLTHIKKLAYLDDMTGLPNRKERIHTIEQMIQGPNPVSVFTVIQFDIDNFRIVNDYFGYQIGDTYLTEISHNVSALIQSPDTIGRLGGDEFMVILKGSRNETEIEKIVSEFQGAIAQPFYFKDQEYKATASFGISRYPKDGTTAVQIIQQAELAMYKAKSQGKNKIMFFDDEMQNNLEYHIRFSRELENAIKRKELYVEYQPVYNVRTKELRGFEVLARWTSKNLGKVAPLDFIPLAEENGSIVDIGRWIFREACQQYTQIFSSYENPPILAVNISVVQLRDPRFIEGIEKILKETGMNPNRLEFEITESVCINNPTMVRHILNELKRLGIRISLDDFGTGYSSLSYLRSLPFDVVKIDKSFIDTIGVVDDSKNLVSNIISMAHQLDLHVIAEGVERQEQFDYLLRHGCDYIQGNYLGKPIVAAGL